MAWVTVRPKLVMTRVSGPEACMLPAAPPALGHLPHAPHRGGIGERISMHQNEIGRTTFAYDPGVRLAEQDSAIARRRGQRLPRRQTRCHQAFDLPCQLVGSQRSAAEVGA